MCDVKAFILNLVHEEMELFDLCKVSYVSLVYKLNFLYI